MSVIKITDRKNTLPDVIKVTSSTGEVKIFKIKK
jgi:hypothetical protein